MAIKLDAICKPVFVALEAAGIEVLEVEPWGEQADAELKLSEQAHVQVGCDGGGAYFMLGVWVDERTLHQGPLREDPAEIVADARAWLDRGELRGPG